MRRQQYINMLLWPYSVKEDFVKGGATPKHTFATPWIHPLAYLVETTTRMVAFQLMQMSPANYSDVWLA